MDSELIGASFGIAVGMFFGLLHLATARDPYQNFLTQLLLSWYDAHSLFEGPTLRRWLYISAVVYFGIAAMCVVAIIVRLNP